MRDLRGTGIALTGYVVEDGARVRLPLGDVRHLVATAGETGFAAAFVPQHHVWDPFTVIAAIAPHAPAIRLGVGVEPVGARSAAALAITARTLRDVTGGRFVLGIGPGDARRVADVRSYASDVRARLPDVPVWLGALGPRMTEAAGEVADGVLLNWCTPERVASARQEIGRGAERAGRDPTDVRVGVYVRACLGPDEAAALGALEATAATYASMPAYRAQLDALGVPPDPAAIVRATCAWGMRAAALAAVDAYREAGADLVVVYPVPIPGREPASSLLATIMAAAPDPAVEP